MISMHIDLREKDLITDKPTLAVLGMFDGVHLAHTSLIEKGVKRAEKENLSSAVFTFENNIKMGGSIITNSLKEKYITKTGADILLFQKIDEDFLKLEPDEFISILIDKLNLKIIYVGENYTFGKNKSGNTEMLKRMSKKYSVETVVCSLESVDGEIISTSRIKKYLEDGNIKMAKRMLGRNYEIEGIVEHGNHIGSTIGFPTVNIYPDKNMFLPRYGVYKTLVYTANGKRYRGVTNIGVKPTVDKPRLSVETHILNAQPYLYGENITVELTGFIRPERKFSGLAELKMQIEKDKKEAENED